VIEDEQVIAERIERVGIGAELRRAAICRR
jgi:hypothetical protein